MVAWSCSSFVIGRSPGSSIGSSLMAWSGISNGVSGGGTAHGVDRAHVDLDVFVLPRFLVVHVIVLEAVEVGFDGLAPGVVLSLEPLIPHGGINDVGGVPPPLQR